MKRKILFVDDEPSVLNSFKRMLYSMIKEWDMFFAKSGKEALDILEKEGEFDIVISDVSMPEMNGVELLTEVMSSHPKAIRIILSGHMEEELGLEATKVANQCLWKPCDAQTLKAAITRVYSFRNRLTDPELQKLISQLESLPSLPKLYTELEEEIKSDEPSNKKISGIISKDIGMASKILQLVNSAFFGISRNIFNPSEATDILGIEIISSLFLETKLFKIYKESDLEKFSLQQIYNHSLITGFYAKEIAKLETQNKEIIDGCFLSGLLHDIGKLIYITNLPQKYSEVLNLLSNNDSMNYCEAEKQVFGATHSEIGASLLGTWGLPDSVVEAVAFYHFPSQYSGKDFGPLAALHAANFFANKDNKSTGLDNDYLERCGFSGRISVWEKACIQNDELTEAYS
jgi:putative nucleotidyltransferase with HDIG domain